MTEEEFDKLHEWLIAPWVLKGAEADEYRRIAGLAVDAMRRHQKEVSDD